MSITTTATTRAAYVVSDDHSGHGLPVRARVEFLHHADGSDWWTQGIEGDERAIDPRDLRETVTAYAGGSGAPNGDRRGRLVTIVRPLAVPQEADEEVGAMFVVRFRDGSEADVFADELAVIPSMPEWVTCLPERDTTPAPILAPEDYTFDQVLTHLHDHHGFNAASMAEDEEFNGTEPEVVARIRAMTRDEAIRRLPGHFFQAWDSPDSLASALLTHAQEHADNPGGYGAVHFHPGRFNPATDARS